MEGKGSFFILLVIVAVLTLTLAILAFYLFSMSGAPAAAPGTVETEETVKRPPDGDLASRKLFEEKKIFNLKSEDNKLSIIQVNVEMVYFKKPKGIRDVEEKLIFHEGKIKQIVGTYFQSMTLEEAKKPETKDKVAEELKQRINEELLSSEKKKENIIYEVVFDEWFYQ